MAKLEIDLPEYMVGKGQKGSRKNGGEPYVLYYWQPWKELRAAGFRSVALGRDLEKAIAAAKQLNDRLAAWRRGEDPDPGLPPKTAGSIPHLIDVYQASEDYLDKAPKTRGGYDRCLEILREWSAKTGHPRVDTITRRGLRELHKALRWPQGEPCGHADGCPADRRCAAGRNTPCPIEQLPNSNAVLRVASILLGVAVDEGFIATNLAKGLKLPTAEGRDQVWPDEAIAKFCATAIEMNRRSVALAVRMASDLGQREGDILAMHRGQRHDGLMVIRPQKTRRRTRKPIQVPLLPELARLLDEAPKTSTIYVISEETGQPYRPDNFRHVFAEIRAAAGIDDIAERHGIEGGLLFMDLRRTAVVHLARAGCSVLEIAAITGHSISRTVSILEVYLPRDAQMAAAAIAKLAAWRDRKTGANPAGIAD
ncbi:MAG: tyrosine-type recombinase/integrase [Stellaceae bacterium]